MSQGSKQWPIMCEACLQSPALQTIIMLNILFIHLQFQFHLESGKLRPRQIFLISLNTYIFLPMGLELYRPAIKFLMIHVMSWLRRVGEQPVICVASGSSCRSQPHIPGVCLGVRAEVVRSGACGRALCQVYFKHWCSELFKMHIVCVHLTEENASYGCPGLLVCQMIKSSSPAAVGSLSMVLPGQGVHSRVWGSGWPFNGTPG